MRIHGADQSTLELAAARVGVRLYSESTDHVRLKTVGPRPKYRKLTRVFRDRPQHTVPGAVCWHGHRDFLRALFGLAPGAVVKTALATYRGKEDFEASYRDTRYKSGAVGAFVMMVGQTECACDFDE